MITPSSLICVSLFCFFHKHIPWYIMCIKYFLYCTHPNINPPGTEICLFCYCISSAWNINLAYSKLSKNVIELMREWMNLLLPTGLVFSPSFHWECSGLRVLALCGASVYRSHLLSRSNPVKKTNCLVTGFSFYFTSGPSQFFPFFQVQVSIF